MIFKNIEDDPYHEILPFKTGFSHLYFILAIVLILSFYIFIRKI